MDSDSSPSGLLSQFKMIVGTCLATLQNRSELFFLELEEQKTHVLELLVWALAAGLLGLMFLVVFTAVVVWLFPPELRIWAAAGFCVLYLAGALLALLNLKSLLKHSQPPFAGSLDEMKKDREWLESSR